jgi:rhodanese-related sulfurtransferase
VRVIVRNAILSLKGLFIASESRTAASLAAEVRVYCLPFAAPPNAASHSGHSVKTGTQVKVIDLKMAQFVEFIGNHLILASLWSLAAGGIVFYHQRTGSKGVSPQGAVMLINRQDAVVVDIRDKKEFESGHIVDAINIPLISLKKRAVELKKHKSKPIVVVCKLGQHAGEAAKILMEEGYADVVKLSGGVSEWKAQSLPLVNK